MLYPTSTCSRQNPPAVTYGPIPLPLSLRKTDMQKIVILRFLVIGLPQTRLRKRPRHALFGNSRAGTESVVSASSNRRRVRKGESCPSRDGGRCASPPAAAVRASKDKRELHLIANEISR